MTRITNFGRKRTFVEAGFSHDTPAELHDTPPVHSAPEAPTEETAVAVPAKKKRKRTPMSKRDGNGAGLKVLISGADVTAAPGVVDSGDKPPQSTPKTSKSKSKKAREKRPKGPSTSTSDFSESRRQKRIAERQAGTICFACRQQGHAAKDCPVILPTEAESEGATGGKNKSVLGIGICYRCGSNKHTLARCSKPRDPANPQALPFASCFVCSGKGHLASACPSNKSKGIYPNGGSCKLCGDTTHLARNCGLGKDGTIDNNVLNSTQLLGTGGQGGGADEDDFHTFKRRKFEVEREEDKMKRLVDAKFKLAGVHSGKIVPLTASLPPAKKVVNF